jgi:hypothetical protein
MSITLRSNIITFSKQLTYLASAAFLRKCKIKKKEKPGNGKYFLFLNYVLLCRERGGGVMERERETGAGG